MSAPIQAIIRPLSLALHEVEVVLSLPAEAVAGEGAFTLPAWTPGSYMVRDYARLIDRVVCRDAQGQEVPLVKTDKQTWAHPALPGGATLSYRIYANDLTVRTNHVDARHAHLAGAATFLVPEGQGARPWEVRFQDWPAGWAVATGLPDQDGAFRARDFDTLVDSPFELGRFTLHAWRQEGVRFEFAITGEHAVDEDRIVDGTRRIIDVCARMFGGLPFERYTFLLHLSPGARGGLEHRESTSLLADPFRLETPEGHWDLMTLIAHEFYHAWNVKRLRARDLEPFRYGAEQPTRLLWFHEGVTSLMEWVLVLKAGLVPAGYALQELSRLWTDYTTRAGRHEESLESASFDAWIRLYKPNEWTPNSAISYYDKGALVAWMMDARIRRASEGRCGVEDLVVQLWRTLGDGPLEDRDIRAAYAELAREDPAPFWAAWIQGTAELEAGDIEAAYGLAFRTLAPWDLMSPAEASDPLGGARAHAWTGLTFGQDNRVQHVAPGSPAAEAGLSYGMEVLAVDSWRTTTGLEVQRRLTARGPKHTLSVLACERGRVSTHKVKVGVNPQRLVRIGRQETVTEAQQRAWLAFTGQGSDPCGAPGSPCYTGA